MPSIQVADRAWTSEAPSESRVWVQLAAVVSVEQNTSVDQVIAEEVSVQR